MKTMIWFIVLEKNGLLYPILVKKISDNEYEVISGQRRFRAHEILKKPTIKASIHADELDDFESKKLSLAENIARKDMKHADYVDVITVFLNRYGKTKIVAEELGLSVSTVRKYLNISRLPEKIQEAVNKKEIGLNNAMKALDILGGDETTVDENKLYDVAVAMKGLTPPVKNKLKGIIENEPDTTPKDAVEKAKKRVTKNLIETEVTDDMITRIDKFKDIEGIEKTDDAAAELIDLGLISKDL